MQSDSKLLLFIYVCRQIKDWLSIYTEGIPSTAQVTPLCAIHPSKTHLIFLFPLQPNKITTTPLKFCKHNKFIRKACCRELTTDLLMKTVRSLATYFAWIANIFLIEVAIDSSW